MSSSDILDLVERWAVGYEMLREFDLGPHCSGRIDAVLIPVTWEAHIRKRWKEKTIEFIDVVQRGEAPNSPWSRCGLVGVEVKVSREDFLKGLRENQYDKYSKVLSGIYIAAPRDVAKAKEIPVAYGHLSAFASGTSQFSWIKDRIVCRRHPRFREGEIPNELLWRLILKQHEKVSALKSKHRAELERYHERMGQQIGRVVYNGLLRKLESEIAVNHDGA